MVKTKYNLINQQFGYWTVLYQSEDYIAPCGIHYPKWHCKCICGSEKDILGNELLSGKSKSCGCYKKEVLYQYGKWNVTHGMTNTRLYNIWHGIKERCLNIKNKAYKNYGGRGITICKEWEESFETFYNWAIQNGYEEHLTIDRSDNDKGYMPENCKWVTMKEQQNNKRNNVYYTINGESKTLSEWAKQCGFSNAMMWRRFNKSNITLEEAISIPKITGQRRFKNEDSCVTR